MALPAFGQVNFQVDDTVTIPDGRTGKIESFKDGVAKVKLGPGANDFQYLVVDDLKKVAASPGETFQVGDLVESPGGKQGTTESINGNTAKVKYGPGKYKAVR